MDQKQAQAVTDFFRGDEFAGLLLQKFEDLEVFKVHVTYSDTDVTVKLDLAERSADGVLMTQEAQNYAYLAPQMGLPEDGLGREFTHKGERYQIAGVRKRAPRYPVLARRVRDNGMVGFPSSVVCRCLAAAEGGDE